MPGVKIVEREVFYECHHALEELECDKLEIIGDSAFFGCSLRSINLPSVRIVEEDAFRYQYHPFRSINLPSIRVVKRGSFSQCYALTNVKLGNKLERMKDGWITNDYNIFQNCSNSNHVDLTEGELHETIDALFWRNGEMI